MSNSPTPRPVSDDCSSVLNELGLRRTRAYATLLATAAVLAAGLGVGQALAAAPKPKPRARQNPSFYTLTNKKAKCRAHYSKEAITIRVRRHRHSVVLHQVRCVYTGSGSSLGAAVSFPTNLPTAAISVSVIPGAVDHGYSVAAGQTLDVTGAGVLANDDGSGLSATLVTGPAHGVLTLNRDGTFGYTPASGFSGVDHFSYRDTDASGESSLPATVTIAVTPVLGQVGDYEVTSGSTLSVGAPGVLGAAVGSGLQASLVSDVADGSLTLNADGSFSYTPAPGFSGTDSFTLSAVDGAAQDAGTVTVTIIVDPASSPPVVPQPPSVIAQDFYGAVGNTELQVGGTRGAGPEVYRPGASALAGDSDPGGGSLSTAPGTIATAQGGSVTLAANGTFTYQPAVGFRGASDSFSYQVDTSEGTSATATATIHFSTTHVWYVNNAAGAGGDGSSATPFISLAAVSGHALAGDDIFVFDGSGSSYAGGVVLGANQTLVGQSVGLTVGSDTVVPAAGGANPVIASSSGADVTLGDGDTVSGVTVTNTGGVGISASGLSTFTVGPTVTVTSSGGVGVSATGVDAFTVGSSVTITNTGGDGLDVSGGSGTASVAASITVSGSGNSVAITGRTGGKLTLSGPITDDGSGVSVTNDGGATIAFTGQIVASTGTHPAFTATGGGIVTAISASSTLTTTTATALDVEGGTQIGSSGLVFQSISAGTGSPSDPVDGVRISDAGTAGGLSVIGLANVAGSGGTIQHSSGAGAGVSVTDSGPVSLSWMDITGSGDGVDLSSSIGTAQGLIAELADNTIAQSGAGTGILAQTSGTGILNLTLAGNTVTMGTSAQNAVTVVSGGDGGAGQVCMDSAGNSVTATGSGNGIAVEQLGTGSVFAVNNLASPFTPATVVTLLTTVNALGGVTGSGAPAVATLGGGNVFTTAAGCAVPAAPVTD
jgi:Big-like domain-containing protein